MRGAARPWRPLAALAGVVIALHLLALDRWGRLQMAPGEGAMSASAPALRLRSIAAPQTEATQPPPAPREGPSPAPRAPAAAPSAADLPAPAAIARSIAPSPSPALASPPPGEASEPATASAPAAPARVAASVRLRYLLKAQWQGAGLDGEAELALRHDGAHYEASLSWLGAPALARAQRSAGAVTAQGLAPLRYAERVRSEEATHFDRANAQLVFSGARAPAALALGAQDRLSVLWQLGALLAADAGLRREGSVIALQVATTRDAEVWRFVVGVTETLNLPGGALPALGLQRQSRGEFDPRLELWLAPQLDYAPVRLRLTQPHGDWVEQQWSATDRN